MPDFQSLDLVNGPVAFAGAVSLDVANGVFPWRLPVQDLELFEPDLRSRANMPAGVRASFVSDTRVLRADIERADAEHEREQYPQYQFDLCVDGKLHRRIETGAGSCELLFDDLPAGEKRIELWLTHRCPVRVRRIAIAAGAKARRFIDTRPKWTVYGSSITQCREAAGPTDIWPAIVASRFDLNLTCLGVGGQCHLDPMMARLIRDLPADLISLCIGINIMGIASLSPRTFRACVIGFIATIREKHPQTPMALVSPIFNPPRETTPNEVGMTLSRMRQTLQETAALLQARGDANLHYTDGLALFGPEFLHLMPDELHPNTEGYRVLADRYAEQVMPGIVRNGV